MIKCLAHERGLAQSGAGFAADHNNRFQIATNGGGLDAVDPDRQRFAYDDKGELLAWPVALAKAAGIEIKHNWEWGIRRQDIASALKDKSKIPNNFELAVCPADRVQISTPFWPMGDDLKGTGDPDDPQPAGGSSGYYGYLSLGINEDIVGATTRGKPPVWKDGYVGEVDNEAGQRLEGNLDRVFDPGTVLLMVDAGPNTVDEALNGQQYSTTGNQQGWGYANLITSAQASGPALQHFAYKWFQRIPTKRHPKGAVNVVFADFHAATIKPTGWRPHRTYQKDVPAAYNQNVRISPYAWRDLKSNSK